MANYEFTNSWFEVVKDVWDHLIPEMQPRKILEIGSYEGASACYLIDKLAGGGELEIHCVDTWEGGVEHQPGEPAQADMGAVESRFQRNLDIAVTNARRHVDLVVHKGLSDLCLARLISEGKKNHFDLVYVDGSHQAPDVLCDAVLGFRLLKVGGHMFFDDYLWAEDLPGGRDPLRCPKPAIDAFINLNFRKLQLLSAPLYQVYVRKLSD